MGNFEATGAFWSNLDSGVFNFSGDTYTWPKVVGYPAMIKPTTNNLSGIFMDIYGWLANVLIIFCWWQYNKVYGIVAGIIGDLIWVLIALHSQMLDLAFLCTIITMLKVRVVYNMGRLRLPKY